MSKKDMGDTKTRKGGGGRQGRLASVMKVGYNLLEYQYLDTNNKRKLYREM